MQNRLICIYIVTLILLPMLASASLQTSDNIVYVSLNTVKDAKLSYVGDNIYYRIVDNNSMVVPPQNIYLVNMLTKHNIILGDELDHKASLEFSETINGTLMEKDSGIIIANATIFDNGVIYLYVYADKAVNDETVYESIASIKEEIMRCYNDLYKKYFGKNYSGEISIIVIRVLVPPWKHKEYLDVVRLLQEYVNNNNLQSLYTEIGESVDLMITLTVDMGVMKEKGLSIDDVVNAVKQVRGEHKDIPILINFVKEYKPAVPLDQPRGHDESGSTDANTWIMYGLSVLAIIAVITAIMIYMKKR